MFDHFTEPVKSYLLGIYSVVFLSNLANSAASYKDSGKMEIPISHQSRKIFSEKHAIADIFEVFDLSIPTAYSSRPLR